MWSSLPPPPITPARRGCRQSPLPRGPGQGFLGHQWARQAEQLVRTGHSQQRPGTWAAARRRAEPPCAGVSCVDGRALAGLAVGRLVRRLSLWNPELVVRFWMRSESACPPDDSAGINLETDSRRTGQFSIEGRAPKWLPCVPCGLEAGSEASVWGQPAPALSLLQFPWCPRVFRDHRTALSLPQTGQAHGSLWAGGQPNRLKILSAPCDAVGPPLLHAPPHSFLGHLSMYRVL